VISLTYTDGWYRLLPDRPSRTVKENHGGVHCHPWLPRTLTPRELARLQSFPDSFAFSGKKSEVWVQIGNAVPPLLGKAIAEKLLEILPSKNGNGFDP
jgi:DNA (cytosine-5)-methyltransferase 1